MEPDGDVERQLREALDRRAHTLPYPPAAVLDSDLAAATETEPDLLTTATVLSKSSGRVYLRDKTPNLAALRTGRAVVLILPPDWSCT
jgi:hypothetical protein